MASDTEFLAVWVLWALLGLASFVFFTFHRNAVLKRRVWRVGVPVLGVAFLGLVAWFTRSAVMLLFALPAVALITFLNLRSVRFCDACGQTVYTHGWIQAMRFCPGCGAPLESPPRGD